MEYVSLGYYFDRCWPLSALLSVCCDQCGGWVVVCVGGCPCCPQAACEASLHNGSLEEIDACIGAPILLFT